ncbi:MAG: hypothetical protein GC178_16550 [Flavobacteriales bacterium]|nr:hypothetical protein [Flavobacteriales bacterium]
MEETSYASFDFCRVPDSKHDEYQLILIEDHLQKGSIGLRLHIDDLVFGPLVGSFDTVQKKLEQMVSISKLFGWKLEATPLEAKEETPDEAKEPHPPASTWNVRPIEIKRNVRFDPSLEEVLQVEEYA